VNRFRQIRREAIAPLLEARVGIDIGRLPDARAVQRGAIRGLLHRFDRQLLPLRRPRRFIIESLERLRSGSPAVVQLVLDRIQAAFLTANYRELLFDQAGRRREVLPVDAVLARDEPRLDAAAIVLSAGSDWNTRSPVVLRALKAGLGFRLVMVCYDLIPIRFGQFYKERDRAVFTAYYREAVQFVDRFICISEATARDLRDFASREAAREPDISIETLGADLPKTPSGRLPERLETKRYALFVSTIEPRKNHEMLYRVWLRLLAAGIPQARRFKLVFVGRPGWQTEKLIATFSSDPRVRGSLLHLTGIDDGTLAELYRSAAFCLYPSTYEGFGLPIVEAFSYGRAVIASRGGSLPEVVGELGPCLDPLDEEAWYATIAQWIADPATVEACEKKIATYRAPTWQEVSERYFDAAFSESRRARPPAIASGGQTQAAPGALGAPASVDKLNILYLSCHEVLEWDDLRMFTKEGHRVFSVGSYSSPAGGNRSLRPALPAFFNSGDWQEYVASGCSGRLISKEFARHFDVLIVNHFPDWILDNLAAFADKPIVYRSIGQSIPAIERQLAPLRDRIHVVRYSRCEADLPNFVGADAIIYFGKYGSDYQPWAGGREQPITFYNRYVARSAFCGPRPNELGAICGSWPCQVFGLDNGSLANWQGCVDYEEQLKLYREAPAYLYVHSLPASYLLNLIEAMAVGIPILAPDFSMLLSWHGKSHLRDQAFSRERYEVSALLDQAQLYSRHEDAEKILDLLHHDQRFCSDLSTKELATFARYFDAIKIAPQWTRFLRSLV
jgi:glycosyltransferase involved in cell wall biosynthesis